MPLIYFLFHFPLFFVSLVSDFQRQNYNFMRKNIRISSVCNADNHTLNVKLERVQNIDTERK